MSEIVFFKDKLELQAIKRGEANASDKAEYFEKQRSLEYPKRSILNKVVNKAKTAYSNLYRLLNLVSITMIDFRFYGK